MAIAALGLVSGLAGWWLGRDSVVLAVAVTVLVLLGCLPLRRRAERRVAAWLFPDREQALRSLEQLQTDVHAGARPPEALEQTLQDALRDPALRVAICCPVGRTTSTSGATRWSLRAVVWISRWRVTGLPRW